MKTNERWRNGTNCEKEKEGGSSRWKDGNNISKSWVCIFFKLR